MSRCVIYVSLLALLFLNSCCSSCHQFWENVARGDFYDETLQAKVEKNMAAAAPDRYKAVARVILNRAGGERSFSIMVQVNRQQRKLALAGMSDLGTVMFAAILEEGQLTLKKNNSGWDDETFHDVFAPMFEAIFFPQLTEVAIVQSTSGGRLMHRSRRPDDSIDNYVFDQDGSRWVEYRLQTFAFFGEVERIQRITFSSFQPVKGWSGAYPHQIDVDDDIHGFKARISVRTVTIN